MLPVITQITRSLTSEGGAFHLDLCKQDLGELRQYRDDILNAVTSATDALSSRRKLDGR